MSEEIRTKLMNLIQRLNKESIQIWSGRSGKSEKKLKNQKNPTNPKNPWGPLGVLLELPQLWNHNFIIFFQGIMPEIFDKGMP